MGTEKDGRRPYGVMLPRLPDWRSRLAAEISAANLRPWAWGSHDCMMFAAGVVLAVTGEDLAGTYRGRYVDEAGARALVPDVAAYVAQLAERQGWPEISPNQAQDGDLALLDHGIPIVGVIYGRLVFPKSPAGLRTVTRGIASKVWALGYG